MFGIFILVGWFIWLAAFIMYESRKQNLGKWIAAEAVLGMIALLLLIGSLKVFTDAVYS